MNYVINRIPDNDELMHYGVKGMKWGVRRDAQLLANRRRNKAVRRIKNDYETGKITSEQKKSGIKQANASKKKYLEETESRFKNAKSQKERDNIEKGLAKQAINEVPNRRLKRGAKAVNDIVAGIGYASVAVTGAATIAMMPYAAAPLAAATAVDLAMVRGRQWLIEKGIDKLA